MLWLERNVIQRGTPPGLTGYLCSHRAIARELQRLRIHASRKSDEEKGPKTSLRRAFSASVAKIPTPKSPTPWKLRHSPEREEPTHDNSVDVGGPRFQDSLDSETGKTGVRTAGEDSVYANGLVCTFLYT